MENVELINALRIEVLNTAIGALIASHPDPGTFADLMTDATDNNDKARLFRRVHPNIRHAMRDYAGEMIAFARECAERKPR